MKKGQIKKKKRVNCHYYSQADRKKKSSLLKGVSCDTYVLLTHQLTETLQEYENNMVCIVSEFLK